MDKNVLKITQGALMTAIFGAFVFINRQTAGFLQEILVYIYPLPIAIYAARYGLVTSLPAMAAMGLISFLLAASPVYAFYAITSLLTGLALGSCLYRKASAGKTLFAVMAVSVLVNLTDLVFGAFISGISMDTQVTEMQTMMQEAFTQYKDMMGAAAGTSSESTAALEQAIALVEQTFTADFLKRILVISTVVIGLIQGFLIYQLSLLIMRRLRIRVPAPKNILAFRPPVWTAYAAVGLFLVYLFGFQMVSGNDSLRNVFLTLGLLGYMYLLVFGMLGGVVLLKKYLPGHKFLPGLLSFLIGMVIPYLSMCVGFLYIAGKTSVFARPAGGTQLPAVSGQNAAACSAVTAPESGKTVSAAGNVIPDRQMSIAERIELSQKKDEKEDGRRQEP